MEYLECKICNEAYDEENHKPRNAPCGHELCTKCLTTLISEEGFECPKCRHKCNINTPNDLSVSFGLLDVLRALKSTKIDSSSETQPRATITANANVCNIHCKPISHWCIQCQLWICELCVEIHSESIGCSLSSSAEAIETMKKEYIDDVDNLLSICQEDIDILSLKIKDHTTIVEKLSKKICNWSEHGKHHMDELKECKKQIEETESPHVISELIKNMSQRRHAMYSWFVRNMGTDSPLGIQKALKEGQYIYSELVIEGFKNHARLTQHDERIYVHLFQKQALADTCLIMPFDRLQRIIPKEVSLVFMELTMEGIVKKPIHIRLNNDVPGIREYFIKIFTGQKGYSLKGTTLFISKDYHSNDITNVLKTKSLNLNDVPSHCEEGFKRGRDVTAKRGDILYECRYDGGKSLYFPTADKITGNRNSGEGLVIGHIEEGLDIIQQCHDKADIKKEVDIKITDTGLII